MGKSPYLSNVYLKLIYVIYEKNYSICIPHS
jgi:hypothetical protein